MLNELGEYEQYSAPLGSDDNFEGHRLKYFTLIKKNFSGLERALTIIARHHMFANNVENFEPERIKNILRAWCGFKFATDSKIPVELVNWLPEYIKRNFLNSLLKEFESQIKEFPNDPTLMSLLEFIQDPNSDKLRPLLANEENSPLSKKIKTELGRVKKILGALIDLSEKEKAFDRKIFSLSLNESNEYRAIKYERILANALLLGRLRNHVLLCEVEPFSAFKIKKVTDNKPLGKKLLTSDQDLVLKLTAIRLLQAKYSDQDFVTFNELNLFSWLATETKPENFALDKFIFAETGEKLFEIRSIGGVNVKKFRMHPNWLKNFQLAEEKELDIPENRGRIFFSDDGAARLLKKNYC